MVLGYMKWSLLIAMNIILFQLFLMEYRIPTVLRNVNNSLNALDIFFIEALYVRGLKHSISNHGF